MPGANPLLGIVLHGVGAFSAAVCYTPQKAVRNWSWQSYWLTQAAVCWLLLPLLGAFLTIPDLLAVLRAAPHPAMMWSFLLGAAYGVGGTAFGLAIRRIGFSLTYAIAIGLSTVFGTLAPPLVAGTLGTTLGHLGGGWISIGIALGVAGIVFCAVAGRMKERDLGAAAQLQGFSLVIGLGLSLLAGLLSAVYGFALLAGEPIAAVAGSHGAGMFRGNVVYIFSNSGAFLSTAVYCLWLHLRHRTLPEIINLPEAPFRKEWRRNWLMSVLTGSLWYGQFFFYNLGHLRMGTFQFTSWAIHMMMLILFSIVMGIALGEWARTRTGTRGTIGFAFLVMLAGVLALTYGNYLGSPAP